MSVRRKVSVLRDNLSHMQHELCKGHIVHAQRIAASIDRDIEEWYLDILQINQSDRHKYRLPNGHYYPDSRQQEATE